MINILLLRYLKVSKMRTGNGQNFDFDLKCLKIQGHRGYICKIKICFPKFKIKPFIFNAKRWHEKTIDTLFINHIPYTTSQVFGGQVK